MNRDKRYYYEVGMTKDSMTGHLMADSHINAMDMIVEYLDDTGIKQTDIGYLNIDHVDNDDIMGIQFDEIRTTKLLVKGILMELNISPADLRNGGSNLSSDTNKRLLKYLEL